MTACVAEDAGVPWVRAAVGHCAPCLDKLPGSRGREVRSPVAASPPAAGSEPPSGVFLCTPPVGLLFRGWRCSGA